MCMYLYLGTQGCNKKKETKDAHAHIHMMEIHFYNGLTESHTFHSTDESVIRDCSVCFVSKFTGNDATALPTKNQ